MPRVLIIAYGNPLRSDDGLAWRAAEALQGKFDPQEVEIITLHQLGPELAESASHSECVIFLDASTGPGQPGEVQIRELSAEISEQSEAPRFCHALSAQNVVGMAAQLYSAKPRAFSAAIVGQSFDHGEGLSAPVAVALPELLRRIEVLVTQFIDRKGH